MFAGGSFTVPFCTLDRLEITLTYFEGILAVISPWFSLVPLS